MKKMSGGGNVVTPSATSKQDGTNTLQEDNPSATSSDSADDFLPKQSVISTAHAGSFKSPQDPVKCKFCFKIFTAQKNANRHEASCRMRSSGTPRKFLCEICSQTFSRSDNLSTHLKSCSPTDSCSSRRSWSKCLFPDCPEQFFHKKDLISHLKGDHKCEIEAPISKVFLSDEDFTQWKDSEEERTFSYFSMKCGESTSGYRRYYYCQHDGSARSHLKKGTSKKTSRKNVKGKIKSNKLCIAMMSVKREENGSLQVTYFPSHSHPLTPQDFRHQPLSYDTDKFIDQQLSWNVSPSKIIKTLRDKSFQRDKRDEGVISRKNNFITKKRIRERKRKKRNAKRHHKDDATSVRLQYEELKKEDYNPVVLYKPIGEKCVQGPEEICYLTDSNNLFMFGIQTKEQQDLMESGAGKILIADETHGTNQYDYKLLNIMIVDQNNRGWSVAHLITSRSDQETLKFFFHALKNRSPNLSVNCVITDDDPAIINAMEAGFGEDLRHLLCLWHLHKTFQKNIHTKHVPKSLSDNMYEELRVIIGCKKEMEFLKLCDAFIKKYEKTAQDFVIYFQKNYLTRTSKWAMCYRNFPHGNINTTGHVESLHNKIKKTYFKRKSNKRIDDLIITLLEMEEDDYALRTGNSLLGLTPGSGYSSARHLRGMKLPDDSVKECFENTYEIRSASNEDVSYQIVQCGTQCNNDFCFDVCQEPSCYGLCSHLYFCSCADKSPLCKHIHKVHSFLYCDAVIPTENVNDVPEEADPNFFTQSTVSEEPSVGERYRQIRNRRLEDNLKKLSCFVSGGMLPINVLNNVDSVICDLVNRCESGTQESEMPRMEPTLQFASNEKLKTQLSQMKPFMRYTKRKHPKGNQNLSVGKKAEICKNLLTLLDSQTEDESDLDNDLTQ